jgi:hypothetical protein
MAGARVKETFYLMEAQNREREREREREGGRGGRDQGPNILFKGRSPMT